MNKSILTAIVLVASSIGAQAQEDAQMGENNSGETSLRNMNKTSYDPRECVAGPMLANQLPEKFFLVVTVGMSGDSAVLGSCRYK